MLPALLLMLLGFLAPTASKPTMATPLCPHFSHERCGDLGLAIRFGLVEECKTTIWSRAPYLNLPCFKCQQAAQRAASMKLPQISTETKLQAIRGLCQWLHEPKFIAPCQQLVDDHPEAVQSLFTTTPYSTQHQVCSALTVCQPDTEELDKNCETLDQVDPEKPKIDKDAAFYETHILQLTSQRHSHSPQGTPGRYHHKSHQPQTDHIH